MKLNTSRHSLLIPLILIALSAQRCAAPKHEFPLEQSAITSNNKMLMLTTNQIKLGNINSERVSQSSLGESLSITGVLNTDKELTHVISSRIDGRIEKLYFKETGISVMKGEPIYSLYSERLMTLQQEYLLAKEQSEIIANEPRYKDLMLSAEKKLLLYGFTLSQIRKLSRSTLTSTITFYAPTSGIITKIDATEGGYVSEGTELFQLDDISKLWVEAELYPTETGFVKAGDKISVRINGDDSHAIDATVNFLSPELRSNSQIVILRVSLDNKNNKFKAGQQVQVSLMHSNRNGIAVPLDAVIRNSKGAHLYITAGKQSFEPRVVKIGIETLDQIEITQGITESDTVVISGAYLLYSELVLRKGIDPMTLQPD